MGNIGRELAQQFGVRLALEFRGGDAFCSCLDTALTLVEQCREPNVGVCLDVFHYHAGPSKPEDLERLTAANLFHVQVCDVAGVPREMMTDADRVLPVCTARPDGRSLVIRSTVGATRSQRESCDCETPTSFESLNALIAFGADNRCTIFALKLSV